MILSKKTYKTFDVLGLTFQNAPVCTVLYMLVSIMQTIMSTVFMALTIANFVDTTTAILRDELPHNYIYMPLVLLLLVLGVSTTIGAAIQLVNSRINLTLQRKLKSAIIEMYAALDYKHIENVESWEIISRVSRDPVKAIMSGFDAFIQFMQIIVSVTSVLVLIATQVWWAVFIIVAFSTPMFWLSIRAGKKNYQAGRDTEKFNRHTEYFDEILAGRIAVDERTIFGYGNTVSKRWQKQYEAGRILKLKVNAKMFLITKGSSVILTIIAMIVALTLIEPVISGEMSAGIFMGIVGAVFGMINRLGWQMSQSLENISTVSEYMRDLTEFLKLSRAESALSVPDAEPIEFNSLEFCNVRFQYPSGDRLILDGLSFTLQSGKHYAFVGENGAGKTTITKLLTGLYTEYEGRILINGKELRQYPASSMKALFSVVYQDFAKYYIPFRDNIAIGDIAGTDDESRIFDTVRLARLDQTLIKLSNDLNTPLGKILEGGQDISGGQWQRVAIARSLISRAPIKILDEPTAALDPIGESKIYEEFEKLMCGKTTVFISHRLGSARLADEILVIDSGKVIERGTHDKLMEATGKYAEMFELQREWYQ